MRKISANGPATAVATATTSPCRVPSKTPHAPTPDAANAASPRTAAHRNAGSTVVVANTPLDAYCTANRAMHAPTTLGAGSHPNTGRPGHASTNVASASGDAAFGSTSAFSVRILRANLESERIAEGAPETYDDARGPEEEGGPTTPSPTCPSRARTRRRRRRRLALARRQGPSTRRRPAVGWRPRSQARRDRGADVDDEWFVVVEDVEAGVLVVEERAEDRGGEEHDGRLVRARGSLERLASRGGGVVGRGGGNEGRAGRRASTSARARRRPRRSSRRRSPKGAASSSSSDRRMGARRTKSRSRTNRKTRARRRRDATRAAPRQRNRCGTRTGRRSRRIHRARTRERRRVTGREDHERGAASSAPASHENEINKVLLRARARVPSQFVRRAARRSLVQRRLMSEHMRKSDALRPIRDATFLGSYVDDDEQLGVRASLPHSVPRGAFVSCPASAARPSSGAVNGFALSTICIAEYVMALISVPCSCTPSTNRSPRPTHRTLQLTRSMGPTCTRRHTVMSVWNRKRSSSRNAKSSECASCASTSNATPTSSAFPCPTPFLSDTDTEASSTRMFALPGTRTPSSPAPAAAASAASAASRESRGHTVIQRGRPTRSLLDGGAQE